MLVVGAGPAGMVAGLTLATYGIDVLVVDQRSEVSRLSRTLVISTRGMELMRRWGIEEEVRAGAADVEPCAWVTPELAAAEGAEMPLGYPTDEEAAAVSPTRPAWAPQDHHEPILLARLREEPTARVRFGCELVELGQGDVGVRAILRDRRAATTHEVRACYVVAADGAHSAVRQQLGIVMHGPDDLADYERVEFSASLSAVVGERRYALYVITRPDAAGVLAPRGRGDRWGFSRERAAGEPPLAELGEDELDGLLARATGIDDLQPALERRSSFTFAAQIADRYRQGRGFLVGDAAHRMTPRGGTGMNTAIQDAFDLGWKLAWVLRGWAPDGLLDTYEAERRPVGAHNVARAGEATGARRDARDALPWDLNGRLAHHWVPTDRGPVSTLDLVGDGLSVLAGPADPRWRELRTSEGSAPLAVHVLDERTTDALGLVPGGALLVRPDGRELRRWRRFTASVDRSIDFGSPASEQSASALEG